MNRNRATRAAALAAIAVVTACSYQGPAVRLQGTADALQSLAGEWTGEYSGRESGREGSITFIIRSAGDSAFGDVMMLAPLGRQLMPAHSTQEHGLHARAAEVLRIVFVRVADGHVLGELEPYIAPDCACRVSTTFRGVMTRDAIAGTFTTSGAPGGEQSGEWRVARRRPSTSGPRGVGVPPTASSPRP